MKRLVIFLVLVVLSFNLNAQNMETLEVQTPFKWEAMGGSLKNLSFLKGDSLQSFKINSSLFISQVFNAKVWREDSNVPWLAIVTWDGQSVITENNFRFDQATNLRKERFVLINSTDQVIYLRLGNNEVMLSSGRKSKPMEAYQGWYVVETSHFINGKVEPKDIIVSVANRQKQVQIYYSKKR